MAAKKFCDVFEVIEKVTESDETNEDGDSYDEGDQVEEIVVCPEQNDRTRRGCSEVGACFATKHEVV